MTKVKEESGDEAVGTCETRMHDGMRQTRVSESIAAFE